ncbi:AAA domain-containing protein [Streptomyces sp. NPDC094466]|uniref:AAA domain-containing protein n=1 Tax=Streptomyces sp. NPDC094466 TaxID=3366065 RepID=UPI0037FEFB49
MPDKPVSEEVRDLLHELFTKPDGTGAYALDDKPYTLVGEIEEVVEGMLVRFVLRHPSLMRDREVSLFLHVRGVVGELWEHEVRNLLRLRMFGHPALPSIEDGTFDASRQVAFIMNRQQGVPLPEAPWPTVREWATTHPVATFEQFSVLVDALSQLHGSRIVHRNLTLNAIRLTQGEPSVRNTLSLARFELSALVHNLLHSVSGPDGRRKYDEAMRALFLTPPPGIGRPQHLAYLAPETYSWVFGEVRSRRLDHGSTDVFGLGVLGWELFVDSVTERLPRECAAVELASESDLPQELLRLHSAMRRVLNVETRVPRHLRQALLTMLDSSPTSRCSSFEASALLGNHWADISQSLEPDPGAGAELPRLIAFMPEESDVTIRQMRGWTDHPTTTPAGRDELQAFLAEELKQAELIHSPAGAMGHVRGDNHKSFAQAEWVLIGRQAVWFCAYHYEKGRTHRSTLVIKYLADKQYARDLLAARPRRRIGRFDLVPFYTEKSLADERAGRPSWEDLTEAVKSAPEGQDEDVQTMLRAFDFMLDYQRAVLRARSYPYTAERQDNGCYVLTYDRDRDRRWLHGSPLLTAYADPGRRRRPPLGDFAGRLLAESDFAELVVAADRNGQEGEDREFVGPYFYGRNAKVRVASRLDADSIVVERPSDGRRVPDRGWLRPDDDLGSEVQLHRESRGLDQLRVKAGLARVLQRPRSIALRGRAVAVTGPAAEATGSLRGRAPEIIADMLRLHPFYALQGPPGTGKSTVVSRALRDFLSREHGARVLVSAQSNDALDQLAGKILDELAPRIKDRSVLVLRELSTMRDRKDLPPAMQRLTEDAIAEDLVSSIEARLIEGHPDVREGEERLFRQWAGGARGALVELTERVRSGADVVLATCSIAGTLGGRVREATDMFDWVIIEEAAKAWPTEIVMPLVLGVRWTLVGDYRQLGPHRAADMEAFLDGLAANQHEQIRLHYDNREKYLEYVQLFGRFFEGHEPGREADADHPVDVLDTQFRMHRDIALPFATAFYPAAGTDADATGEPGRGAPDGWTDPETRTFLQSDKWIRRVHGRDRPAYLKGAPLVWLDTSRAENCGDLGHWWNPGEVELVRGLVREMGLGDSSDPAVLTVITPYLRQKRELEKETLKGRVHTVHSFQGSESKIVIVSLVRSGDRGTDFRQNVGHTAQPEVVNVMLSRAKSLMVVVGNMAHFERHGGDDWRTIIGVFREVGRVVDAATGEILSGGAAAPPLSRPNVAGGEEGGDTAADSAGVGDPMDAAEPIGESPGADGGAAIAEAVARPLGEEPGR